MYGRRGCAAALAAALSLSPLIAADGPLFALLPGECHFRIDGRPTLVLGRNPAGMDPQAYDDHFLHAAAAGELLMRIHFTFLPAGEQAGGIDPGMLASWDLILDAAERRHLAVLPVLGVWADWNDGSGREPWHRWERNPFNAARGGPARHPDEIFDDTPCRRLWLQRLETFIRRWSPRRSIVAWEMFSELDLITGASEERAVRFATCAAAVIRRNDPWKRPLTASQSGVGEWPGLLRSAALDISELHPYADGPYGGRLDELIIASAHQRLERYGKPVLLGECGLASGPPQGTLENAARAEVGIRHAIWAALVSGAMNGRMLWWQDGYDQFEKADLCRQYQRIALPAAAFVRGIDCTGFAPVPCELPGALKGAMTGNDRMRLGWFRDARCEPPLWPLAPLAGQVVVLAAPGAAWRAEFIDPLTGDALGEERLEVRERSLRLRLPAFQDALAVRLRRLEPRAATSPPGSAGAGP